MEVSIDSLVAKPPVDVSPPTKSATKDIEGGESFEKHLHAPPAEEGKESQVDSDAAQDPTNESQTAQPVNSGDQPTDRSEEEPSTEEEHAADNADVAAIATQEEIDADPADLKLTEDAKNPKQETKEVENATPHLKPIGSEESEIVEREVVRDTTEPPQDRKSAEETGPVEELVLTPDAEEKGETGNEEPNTQVHNSKLTAAETPRVQTVAPTQESKQPRERKQQQAQRSKDVVAKTELPRTVETANKVADARLQTLLDPASGEAIKTDREITKADPSQQRTSQSSPSPEPGISRLPQHLISRGQRANSDQGQPHVDQARFVQRVAKAFEAAQQRDDGQVRLRLHPPELGSIRLEVRVQGNVLSARVEAETTTARSLLIDNLPALRERLADQGIQIEQFEVDLPQRQPGENHDPAGDQGDRQSHNADSPGMNETREDAPNSENLARPSPLLMDGELNVII